MAGRESAELLGYLDLHTEGCADPDCGVCRETEAVMDELARRLGVASFVPSVRRRRERNTGTAR